MFLCCLGLFSWMHRSYAPRNSNRSSPPFRHRHAAAIKLDFKVTNQHRESIPVHSTGDGAENTQSGGFDDYRQCHNHIERNAFDQ
ncbi:hypothetical protein L2E82_36313 [Cichorium intybus]|uniref:Uncharacterized protein n=1 Tax=Cichorium intybus TaxID=13427 RepID=A0ACB9BR56_CICIN|nr:hypothetical protein L2E82_36313 [Cichorium intybus]